MTHDRIHARKPELDTERWAAGRIETIEDRDGHVVVTVRPEGDDTASAADPETVDLTVTTAIRDLFVSRLDLPAGVSAVGERVWFRRHGE
ncbi:hypothetical protein BRD17_01360 [Halobacteriales archaeon SW_7_68_16]|nr:MAG: hypothetical protein BRD17_01360 [Halobacteriales archaeon SW_7_68_16]